MTTHREVAMTVHTKRDGAVLTITIDRPERRNALDRAALQEISQHLRAAASTGSGVRAVVLTGTGRKAFSAGMDLREEVPAGSRQDDASALVTLRNGYPLPVIAAINGSAVGGGFELALACDLRIAADHATFAFPEVSLGIAPTGGGFDLGRWVGLGIALELLLTALPIGAQRAYELGLVNQVVCGDDLLAVAHERAALIASRSPAAVRATKELALLATSANPDDVETLARQRTEELFQGPDAREGLAAFREKRRAVFVDL